MILAIDVGNTNMDMGVFRGDELVSRWRMLTVFERTSDETGMLILQFLNQFQIKKEEIRDIIISSVVPPVMYPLELALRRYVGLEPIHVTPQAKTGLRILYDNPLEVGADRIVNAVAARRLYEGPLIVVDFGTATTFCAITAQGDYLGGVICPGIKISMEALFARAAKLPRVEIAKPPKVIGKNTVESMQAGAVYGYAGQVECIIAEMKKEMGEGVQVIATGGLARLISGVASSIDVIHTTLTLEGLKILYDMNR